MISTEVRLRPNTTVWRPARRNGIAQRWATVIDDPRAPVDRSTSGGSTRRTWRSPLGAPLRSTSAVGRPVSIVASSPGLAIVAEQQTITGCEP